MQLPRYQGSYGTTIIAGHIESDIPVKEIKLSEINNKTTIATIPIKEDGSFHINLSEINSQTTYIADGIVWLPCGGKATAVMTGWTGPKAPVAMVYSHEVKNSRQMAVAVRRPMAGGVRSLFQMIRTGSQ